MDITSLIIEYEMGQLSGEDTLKLFSELIRTKQCWQLQGHYGRTAEGFIKAGFIHPDGKQLRHMVD